MIESMINKDEIAQKFKNFIENFTEDGIYHYVNQIDKIYKSNTSKNPIRDLYVSLDHLFQYDKSLVMELIASPDDVLKEFVDTFTLKIKSPDFDSDLKRYIRLYSKNLNSIGIRKLRQNHIDKLIRVSGVVLKTSPIKSEICVAAFECQTCGNIQKEQQNSDKLQFPSKGCSNPNCPAKNPKFKCISRESEFIDTQLIKIQEPHMDLERPGDIPYLMLAIFRDTIVDSVRGGQHVKILGIYRSKPSENGKGGLTTLCDSYIDVNNVEIEEIEDTEELTVEEIAKINTLKDEIGIKKKLVNSFAPHIFGYNHLKLGALLGLFGGVEKPNVRGISHVLFMGDPSTAKSQLVKEACKLSPRSVYTTGQGASAAGLTAAVINDANMGGWTIEAGALPRASGTVCGIDEFDKMSEQDRKAIHEVMEQQTTTVAKAGLLATLPAKTTIIAAANPRAGRYDEYQTPTENVDLPPAIISRFDLIFIVKDIADEEKDKKIAEKILANHLGMRDFKEDDSPNIIPTELLKKYILYARKECKPVMNKAQGQRIIDFYVNLRKQNKNFMVARNLDGMIRLCEAYAKMGLQSEVSDDDIDVVLELYQNSLKELGYDPESGVVDMDRVLTGINMKDRNLNNDILHELRLILKEKYQINHFTPYATFLELFSRTKCEKDQLRRILYHMEKQHQIRIEDNEHITTENQEWIER